MKALVTGANGFIGGRLASYLFEAGWQVNVLVRPGRRQHMATVPAASSYQVFESDLSRPTQELNRAAADCDVVFHVAAIRDRWGTSFEEYWRSNVEGTLNLLGASLGQVGRFVYVSSVGVYGHPGVLGIDENFPFQAHVGKVGYHTTKAVAERAVLAHKGDLDVVVARPTITYGPGDWDGMLTRWIAMLARRKFILVGDGTNHLHLTYIDDLLQGLFLVSQHPAAAGEDFIFAGPVSIEVRDLMNLIKKRLGQKTGIWQRGLWIPEKPARLVAAMIEKFFRAGRSLGILSGDRLPPITPDKIDTLCVHGSYSSEKAQRLIGYSPRVGYSRGLGYTLEWLAANGLLPNKERRRTKVRESHPRWTDR